MAERLTFITEQQAERVIRALETDGSDALRIQDIRRRAQEFMDYANDIHNHSTVSPNHTHSHSMGVTVDGDFWTRARRDVDDIWFLLELLCPTKS